MLTILIAEDEQHIREGIANRIDWQDLQIGKVLQAADGEQAFLTARENKVDILLSDIRMPIMDGIQLTKKILELHPDCIIIFMSAYTDKEYLISAIQLKASNYVEKPLQITKLRDALEEAVKSYRETEYRKLKSIMIENNYKISMPLIKNEIALLSSNKNADMNLLMDCIKNDMLSINADISYITVIIKTVDFSGHILDESRRKTVITELFTNLFIILSENELQCFWGTRDEEEYLIHVHGKTRTSQLDQKWIFSLLNHWIDQHKGRKLFAAIGIVVSDFTQIHKSYASAKSALNKCFYRGYGSIISYVHDIARVTIIEKEIIEQIKGALESAQHDTVVQMLQDFSAQMYRYENADTAVIKNIYCKLTTLLLNSLQNCGVNNLLHYENENSLRSEIYAMNTLDEIEKFTFHLMDIYFDTIKKIQSENSISMIISFIEKNYSEKSLDIGLISDSTYLSPAYLCTYFKRETGKTINQYITEYRLNKATEFLLDRKNSISDIAGLIGYDGNYFARIFKKKFGMSPSEYRERFG